MWSKLKKNNTGSTKILHTYRLREPTNGGHQLIKISSGWKCTVCRTKGTLKSIGHLRCRGSIANTWASKAVAHSDDPAVRNESHLLMRSGNVQWCNKCGAYAEDKAYGLAKACTGHITDILGGGRLQQLMNLRKGRHPKDGYLLGCAKQETGWHPLGVASGSGAKAPTLTTGRQRILAVQQRVRMRIGASSATHTIGPIVEPNVEVKNRPVLSPQVEAIRQRVLLREAR